MFRKVRDVIYGLGVLKVLRNFNVCLQVAIKVVLSPV